MRSWPPAVRNPQWVAGNDPGVALPHQHITWFATKVEAVSVPDVQVVPPAKGKKIKQPFVAGNDQHSLKDWGKEGQTFMQAIMCKGLSRRRA